MRFGIHEQPFYSESFSSLVFWSKLTFDPSFSTEILINVDPSCIARPYTYVVSFSFAYLKNVGWYEEIYEGKYEGSYEGFMSDNLAFIYESPSRTQ